MKKEAEKKLQPTRMWELHALAKGSKRRHVLKRNTRRPLGMLKPGRRENILTAQSVSILCRCHSMHVAGLEQS
jgi:hypothetical protein